MSDPSDSAFAKLSLGSPDCDGFAAMIAARMALMPRPAFAQTNAALRSLRYSVALGVLGKVMRRMEEAKMAEPERTTLANRLFVALLAPLDATFHDWLDWLKRNRPALERALRRLVGRWADRLVAVKSQFWREIASVGGRPPPEWIPSVAFKRGPPVAMSAA